MYTIKYENAGKSEMIMDTRVQGYEAIEPVIKEGINKVSSFSVSLPQSNSGKSNIEELVTEIIVDDKDSGNEAFRGRCTASQSDFYNTTTYNCEGVLAYLLDTQYPPYVHTGSPSAFLKTLLDYHNSRVTEKQKIYLGNVTVVDNNDYIRRESKNYDNVYNIIQEKLIKLLGGWIQLRRVNDKHYLDYHADYIESDQTIRFGENLIDLMQYVKAETIKTVIIPRGAQDADTGKYVDITSVNNSVAYVKDDALVQKYGWIEAVVDWPDVTEPANLLKKAREYMNSCKNMAISIDVSAIDGRVMGLDVTRLRPGMMVRLVSEPHKLDTVLLCSEKTTNLLDPSKDTVVLGNTFESYTQSIQREQKEANEKFDGKIDKTESKLEDKILAEKAALEKQINEAREDFGEAIKNASGLYKTEVKQDDGSTVIYYHDKPNLKDSLIQMTFNSSGFGLSADGGNTWYGMEVDGDMIANILSVNGINANWIRSGEIDVSLLSAGKIRSKNFVEGESGTEIDLYTGDIRTMYINPYTGHHYSVKISESQIKFENHDTGFSVGMSASGFSIIDSEDGQALDIMSGTIQLSDYDASTGHVYGRVFVSKNGIQMEEDTDIHIHDSNGYYAGKTGRAEFSDGTYIDFKNGIMVGGYTAEGGNIS